MSMIEMNYGPLYSDANEPNVNGRAPVRMAIAQGIKTLSMLEDLMRRRFPRPFFLRFAIATAALVGLPSIGPAQMQMDHGGHGAMAGTATFRLGDLTVTSPWTRATPGGAKIGGGYLKITNNGRAPDRFVGGKSDVSDHVEIHEMSMTNGVMKMRPLPNGLEIKPGETVELKPGGNHLMFVDLKRPLKQGESVRATLQFEKAGSLEVTFAVNALGGNSPMH